MKKWLLEIWQLGKEYLNPPPLFIEEPKPKRKKKTKKGAKQKKHDVKNCYWCSTKGTYGN